MENKGELKYETTDKSFDDSNIDGNEQVRDNKNNNNIILLKQDCKIQLANNKIQMARLTSWLVVG